MTDERDLELGPMDSSAPPGSYVTQMRAAQNPVRFAQGGGGGGGGGGVEGVQNAKNTASPPGIQGRPQPNRGLPPHYGIEGEPECCLCSKVGRILLVTFVAGFAALVVLYIYWPDIVGLIETPETHAEALKSQCGVDLMGTELQPAPSLLQEGAMDWGAICDQNNKSITVMKKIPKTWRKQEINAISWKNGFGDLSSSFWLGLKLLQQITNNGRWNLRVDLKQSDKKDIQVVFHDFTVENWTISLYTVKHKPQSKEGFDVPRLAAEAELDTKETPCHLDMSHHREKRQWWNVAKKEDAADSVENDGDQDSATTKRSAGATDDDAETDVGSTTAPTAIATENAAPVIAEDEKADKEDASTVADDAVADDAVAADGAVAADVETTEASAADDTIVADDKATDASATDASAADASVAFSTSATKIAVKETAEEAKGSEDAAPTSEAEEKEDVEEIEPSEIAETTATTSVEGNGVAAIPTAAVADAAPEVEGASSDSSGSSSGRSGSVSGSSGSESGYSAPKKPESNAIAPNAAAVEGVSPEMKSCLFQKIFEQPCACVFTCGGQKICPAELTLTLVRA